MIIQKRKAQWMGGAAAVGMMLSSAPLLAESSVSFAGLIRQEMAASIGDRNPYNQHGITTNGETQTRFPFPVSIPIIGQPTLTPTPYTRPDFTQDNDWNLMATRVELDMNVNISNDWTAFVRLRGFFDNNIYKDYENPSHFESQFWGDCGTVVEICDENYMVDLPSAYLDYSHGPVWLRIGNQQIAWGESIFFRVIDAPNGLDLRRHNFLDWASEEYADERIASPAIRGSVRFADEWELEGFVQAFSPTIYPGDNTPYNFITSQFVLNSDRRFDDVRGDLTSGLRLKGQFGDLALQFMAINRRNPDGVISWGESRVNPFVGAGAAFGCAPTDPGCVGNILEGGLGPLLAQQPFEAQPFSAAPEGIGYAAEYFEYASRLNIDPTGGTVNAVTEFPAIDVIASFFDLGGPVPPGLLGAIASSGEAGTAAVLDTFFTALGPLKGHIERRYPWENVFGFGMNYMVTAEQGSFLDQLMLRFEATFTPDKQFTDPALGQRAIEADEWATSVVIEKYHRFSQSFPATFMVFEWLRKTESDMFGRHLSGYDGTFTTNPKGRSEFNALAFAMQQPSKTLMWRFDLAVLYDVNGGHLIQPGVRYKPNGDWTAELYGNFLDGGNDDMMSILEWSDEIGVRIGYQF